MASEEGSSYTVKLELPKEAYDFIKNEAKRENKTVEEFVDLCIQTEIASRLICLVYDEKRSPEELAIDLGLDGYIVEGKKAYAPDFEIFGLRGRGSPQPAEP
ncbi:MAG: hypothetical protein JRN44_01120 [Nitrososphaerota archaeon]|jgi:hypothetical protein|nr:hypothetical protein [Nitrososphaerota archaeon]MDG6941719.1 hypothetical protein [Nitrososphaerota archaeon]MDG6947107.1 hypothetical protein [Nitrososphaerota archaeon]MDG6951343.1 hypothetical protein [Nitrososphaerota archaeon]